MMFEAQIQQIKNHINNKTQHPYLDQFITKPKIDDDKIHVLLSMFHENGSFKNSEHFVAAIMIMQMALDMHDTVAITLQPEMSNRKQQLTVLAGDYYSSQYYCMLAEVKAFSMIRILSDGIKRLNEVKVDFLKGKKPWEQIISQMKRIEASLIIELAEFLDLNHWVPLLTTYFAYKRLLIEQKAIEDGVHSIFMGPYFQENPERRSSFIQECDGWLSLLKDEMESELQSGNENERNSGRPKPIWIGEILSLTPNKLVEEGLK